MKANVEEIQRYLGYKNNTLDGETLGKIEDCIGEIMGLLKKSYVYKIYDIVTMENEITLKGTVLSLRGRDIQEHLKGSKKCALMAVTLGIEADRKIAYYSKFNLSRAVIMDACASSIVESICDDVQNIIKGQAEKSGLNITERYSPGYGDFSLEHQKGILRVLDTEKSMGLTLTDSFLLLPRKSVTAIIGLKEDNYVIKIDKCMKCNLENCEYRRAGAYCG